MLSCPMRAFQKLKKYHTGSDKYSSPYINGLFSHGLAGNGSITCAGLRCNSNCCPPGLGSEHRKAKSATASNVKIIILKRVSAAVLLTALCACGPGKVELGEADYAALALPAQCAAASPANDVKTPGGLRINVRAPANYDARLAHPLLVVYPAAGQSRHASESFSGLTREATARGFIVAYPDHRPLKLKVFDLLGEVPATVAREWCVDQKRVWLAGHSDGGTAASALVFLNKSSLPASGILVSAAGLRAEDLRAYACPVPRPVMIVHSKDDRLFPPPAYGSEPAQWWAQCNRCEAKTVSVQTGCVEYSGCANGARTLFCEVSGGHSRWPGINAVMLDFAGATLPNGR
jgi:polyhydroxybutyrate depolymerase